MIALQPRHVIVAKLFMCAAKLILSTPLSDIGLHFHPPARIFPAFSDNGVLTAGGIVMSGNDSKQPCDLIAAAYRGDVTALMLAAERGHIELEKVLLEKGADVNAANLNGETALMRAAENDRAAAVKILLAHHADGDAGDIVNCTPLMRAAYRGHVDVVKELLAYGANANARNAFGNTAATLAAHNGHSKVVSMLREADGIGFVESVRPKLRAARR
jgi:ankyrin repeat protein